MQTLDQRLVKKDEQLEEQRRTWGSLELQVTHSVDTHTITAFYGYHGVLCEHVFWYACCSLRLLALLLLYT